MEKLHELFVALVNRILGMILDLRCLTIGTTLEFIAAMFTLLRTLLGPHHHFFKVKEAKELTGKLNHIAFSSPWLKYLFEDIYSSLAMALCKNNLHLIRTNLLNVPPTPDGNSQCAFHAGSTT